MADMDAGSATLCQSCGLCCDGSLFGRVPLDPREVGLARRNRLRVVAEGKSFEQPCTALSVSDSSSGAKCACSIYDERPRSCRAFKCRLLDRYRREGGPIGRSVAVVQRVRQLVAELQAHGLSAADFQGDPRSPSHLSARVMSIYAELQRRLAEDFARA